MSRTVCWIKREDKPCNALGSLIGQAEKEAPSQVFSEVREEGRRVCVLDTKKGERIPRRKVLVTSAKLWKRWKPRRRFYFDFRKSLAALVKTVFFSAEKIIFLESLVQQGQQTSHCRQRCQFYIFLKSLKWVRGQCSAFIRNCQWNQVTQRESFRSWEERMDLS